ncbi:WD domain-containing protein, G-beta repeat-containing protein [Vibrio hangzhouensis]|uniref:WD domain-containing protein, G-beta repeat-containing protein n=2 Tax=Vibrio hangzhouensis TaxID=462991 RepID=A0A1H6CJ98_9VIBR|nr:WD domain-containing protein, G-beta repeat-containing protein [Vibrio hangzhouensis]
MMRIISHSVLWLIVISLLNGCFFSTNSEKRWDLAVDGSTAIALSRDARFALLYSKQQHLQLWDLNQNELLARLGIQDPEQNIISLIRFSDNGRFAVTATQTNFAIWDLGWSQSSGLWSVSDGLIQDIALGNSGDEVLIGLSNGKAIFIDLVTGRRLEFLAHVEKVNSVALSPNGKYALSGGNDHNAYFWSTESGQILRQFEHQQRVGTVELQRDGRLALTSDTGNNAIIWDLHTGERVSQLSSWSRQLIFSAARFSDDGTLLATGSPSSRMMIWSTASGKRIEGYEVEMLKDVRPPRGVVYDAAFESNQRVLSASSAGVVQAWKVSE